MIEINGVEIDNFEKALAFVINCFSKENNSNTQDFILAKYLSNCLKIFEDAIKERTVKT